MKILLAASTISEFHTALDNNLLFLTESAIAKILKLLPVEYERSLVSDNVNLVIVNTF
jgi:hypothetical protein